MLTYALARGRSRRADRWVLGALRTALFLVLFFIVMQPALVLTSVVPQRNFLAVLVDDSRSMTIDDRDGSSRAAKAHELLDPEATSSRRWTRDSRCATSASLRRREGPTAWTG